MKYRLFSQRQAESTGAAPPPQRNTAFSPQLRRNIASIFTDVIGWFYDGFLGIGNEEVESTKTWETFERFLLRESSAYAEYAEHKQPNLKADRRIKVFLRDARDSDVLDVLDLGVAIIENVVREFQRVHSQNMLQHCRVRLSPDAALAELDIRLRESGMVYRIADGVVIKSTDDFMHENAVVPALQALAYPGFESAAREFHEAFEAFRNGKFDIVLHKSLQAFESTMKVIAGKMGWPYDQTFTAKKMLDVMFANGLLPTMRDSAMKSLATMLESDVPTLRNKVPSAGHGAGEQKAEIPEALAVYALNATAANVRLLVDSYLQKKKR